MKLNTLIETSDIKNEVNLKNRLPDLEFKNV